MSTTNRTDPTGSGESRTETTALSRAEFWLALVFGGRLISEK